MCFFINSLNILKTFKPLPFFRPSILTYKSAFTTLLQLRHKGLSEGVSTTLASLTLCLLIACFLFTLLVFSPTLIFSKLADILLVSKYLCAEIKVI